MHNFSRFFTVLFILTSLFWLGCASTTSTQKNKSDYNNEIRKLTSRINKNRSDAEAWRDLGAIYFDLQLIPKASKFLIKAFKLNKNDAKTLYYVGLIFEHKQKPKQAIKFYKKYSHFSRLSPYQRKMRGRYQLLNRQILRQEMRALLQREQHLTLPKGSAKTVAVFPMTFTGDKQEYAALGKGVSEMMITDLSQVRNLKVVERVRLQALMDEIGLGQSGIVDENTAPRFGKLLGAGKIVHGSYDLMENKKLMMDVAFLNAQSGQAPDYNLKQDDLDNLFLLEKELVFDLIQNMNIDLTPAEREKIQRIPTKNMQAFMAYSKGLELEDSGRFETAARFYFSAIKQDPNFKQAREKVETIKSLVSVRNGADNKYVVSRIGKKKPGGAPVQQDLVNQRLQFISDNLGSTLMPGQDSRESAEEVNNSGINVFGDLPLPPAPPERR